MALESGQSEKPAIRVLCGWPRWYRPNEVLAGASLTQEPVPPITPEVTLVLIIVGRTE